MTVNKDLPSRAAWALALAVTIVACTSDTPPAPEPVVELQSPLIALTPTEYNNTIRDLRGMPMKGGEWPSAPAIAAAIIPNQNQKDGLFGGGPIALPPWPWDFPDEIGLDDFDGMAAGQVPTAYSVEEVQKAAIHFAVYALVSPSFFTCQTWAEANQDDRAACGWESVERFAQRAWRRPITNHERTRLAAFWQANLMEGTAEEAVVFTLAGILQAPAFLFRVERGDAALAQGGIVPLTGWELASKLSYFLWDSLPDPQLYEAAAKGQLATKDQVEAQAERMLADPRARGAVVHFHHQWLGTDRVHTISPARRSFGPFFGIAPEPPLDTSGDGDWPAALLPVRHSMDAETHLFIERTVFDGAGSLKALLSDNHGYVSPATQAIYGDNITVLSGVPTVDWDYALIVNSGGQNATLTLSAAEFPATERAGLLTLPSVLAIGAYPVHPAPILRGKRILERIACEEFGAPPPGAESAAPPDADDAEATNRERTAAATSPTECAACHEQLNPPGFAFENYDALGVWRERDNGQAIDASGSVGLSGGESFTFSDGVDFARQLSTSEQVRNCYVLRWARYASGVHLGHADRGVMDLQRRFQADDDVLRLLVAITGSDMFRFRSQAGTP
jgi:hypothetical protein